MGRVRRGARRVARRGRLAGRARAPPGRARRRSGCRSSRRRPASSRGCGSSGASRSSRSAAARSAMRRGSSRPTYLRGVPLIQVPTTLVAQVDSAIGGKTGVDLRRARTCSARSTSRPRSCSTSPRCGRSRAPAAGRAGRDREDGRARRRGAVRDARGRGEAIARGDATRRRRGHRRGGRARRLGEGRGRERGRARARGRGRITLNLGHTIGHALEAADGYETLLHGEAVAYGPRAAVRIGEAVGVTPAERARRIEGLLDRLALGRRRSPTSLDAVLEATCTDKKHAAGGSAGCCPRPTASWSATTSRTRSCARRRPPSSPAPARGPRHDPRPRPPGPEPEPARDARAGDLRHRDARRDPRGTPAARRSSASTSTSSSRTTRAPSSTGCTRGTSMSSIVNAAGLPIRRSRSATRSRHLAAVLGGPPLRPLEARAVPQVNFLHDVATGIRRRSRARAAITWRSRQIAAQFGGGRVTTDDNGTPPHRPTTAGATTRARARPHPRPDRRAGQADRGAAQRARGAGARAGRAKALAGRRAIRDPEREREVLLRVAMANGGPLTQADLLSIYRRLVAATRTLEAKDRGQTAGPVTARSSRRPLFVPVVTGGALPDPRLLPSSPVTRFAPAPTGQLHLGHLVNVLYVWGIARATGGRVILRIEDHDRQRSRPEFEASILDDLERLASTPTSRPSPRSTGTIALPPVRLGDGVRGGARTAPRGRARLRVRLRRDRRSRVCRRSAAGRGAGSGVPGDCRDAALRRTATSGCGSRRGGRGALGGPARRADRRRPAATGDLLSAIGSATGRTPCASSSTTCATASTS